MLSGCFYFSPFIGGEVVNFINNLRYLNKCPNCNQGTVFDGLIKLKNYYYNCNVKLNSDQIGDGASRITTTLVCFIIILLLFFYEINKAISLKTYLLVVFPSLVIVSIILFRILRYFLLKKYYDVI